MKKFIFVICMLAALCRSGGAEAAESSGAAFAVPAGADVVYLEVNAVCGRDFEITLEANATTGYEWNISGELPAALSFVARAYEAPAGELSGAGGRERFRCHARAAGEFVVVLEYARPWEDEPAAWAMCRVYVAPPR
ncbi:MAG: protease inhibitor I42 family protein [Synergistaceae bacterium]|nr:protease inhibitor I42 family protein [Synergistaceae bacterium]